MSVRHVPLSTSKTVLMQTLGLTPGNRDHEELYVTIKQECIIGYDNIISNRSNLIDQYKGLKGRYAYNHIRAAAIDNAIITIYHNAQPGVKQWFAHWGVDETPNNWIIRWFLYKIFRYRDARNSRRPDFHADDDEGTCDEEDKTGATTMIRDQRMEKLPLSADKPGFLTAIGLNGNPEREEIYKRMHDQVKGHYFSKYRVSGAAAAPLLKPRYHGKVKNPPYKWEHLSRSAIDDSIITIYYSADGDLKHWYEKGWAKPSLESNHKERRNVAIEWLLWHTVRNYDKRGLTGQGGFDNREVGQWEFRGQTGEGGSMDMEEGEMGEDDEGESFLIPVPPNTLAQ
ncbi:hypothetical protein MMC25_006584 [Agyrium rufum]|nr:hypothetical protein [Agyrium rufum]